MTTHEARVKDRNKVHQEAFKDLGKATVAVVDTLQQRNKRYLIDFDGQQLELLINQLSVEGNELPVMIKTGSKDEEVTLTTYRNLLQLKHPLMVTVEHFCDKSNWLVLDRVSGTLRAWLTHGGGEDLMFKGTGTIRGMSQIFRDLIISIWNLTLKMAQKRLYPIQFSLENLFVKLLPGNIPRFQILLTKFKELKVTCFTTQQAEELWCSIDTIIKEICSLCGCEMNMMSNRFFSYIKYKEKESLIDVINYPDGWTDDDKSSYLYHAIAAKRDDVRKNVNHHSNVRWPESSDGYILRVLDRIRYLHKNTIDQAGITSKYDTDYPYDYVKLLRDTLKHFDDLPDYIKWELGGSRKGFIQWIEYHDPEIWILLYEAIGALGKEL